MISDIAKLDIPSSRTLTYRRNTLAIGCVLALLYWFPTINLSDISFFGVRPPAGSDQRALVFRMLWALLIYHLLFFGYYAGRDWRRWLAIALHVDRNNHTRDFPELGMYFGQRPKRAVNRTGRDGNVKADWGSQHNPDNGELRWSEVFSPIPGARADRLMSYVASSKDVKILREAVGWFVAIDLGVPILTIIICALLAVFA